MIRRPTVFVLGAGASIPYGFPSGPELARQVHSELSSRSTDLANVLQGLHGIHADDLRDFVEHWPEATCDTLDEFVESEGNRRFLPLVKAAIVEKLVAAEDDAELIGFSLTDRWSYDRTKEWLAGDWCGYLMRHVRAERDASNFRNTPLSVITFNFDRSFERRLFLAIKSGYGVTEDEASRLRAVIGVVHIHGRLGGEAWLGERRPDSRQYGAPASGDQRLELARHHVKLIHEELEPDVIERARRLLENAERVAFLGFGFHRTNLVDRLGVDRGLQAVTRGTALGFTDEELTGVRRLFPRGVHLYPRWDCLTFLREGPMLHSDQQ